jgi:hypothetical protein
MEDRERDNRIILKWILGEWPLKMRAR